MLNDIMITLTAYASYKRNMCCINKHNIETCYNRAKRIDTKMLYKDKLKIWMSIYNNVMLKFVEHDSKIIIIDIYKL